MTLARFNQKYEEIIQSNISSSNKDRELVNLMSIIEAEFKIPIARDEVWEKENRVVIALFRKISLSRSF